jgi:hypothetical protein
VLPTLISVPEVPINFPRLYVYTRAIFDPNAEISELTTSMILPNGERITIEDLSEVARTSCAEARELGLPQAGLYSSNGGSPFPLPMAGDYVFEAKINGEARTCGSFRVHIKPAEPAEATPSPPAPRPKRTIKKL